MRSHRRWQVESGVTVFDAGVVDQMSNPPGCRHLLEHARDGCLVAHVGQDVMARCSPQAALISWARLSASSA
jgi:hypothetical protein